MDDDEFEDALARAVHGEVLTDLGASAAMLEALILVAAARSPAERRPALRAARRLQEQEQEQEQEQDARAFADPEVPDDTR